MTNCMQCDQELNEGSPNMEINLCLDCVLENSMRSGIKVTIYYCVILMAGIFFIISLIPCIVNLPLLLTAFEENIGYFSLNIIISTLTGTILIVSPIFSIYRKYHDKKFSVVKTERVNNVT